MTRLITSSLSSKAQLTLPKEVRAILGVSTKGDLVGFLLDSDSKSVQITKVEAVVANADFSEEEYRKLALLRGKKSGKRFKSMSALLRDLNG